MGPVLVYLLKANVALVLFAAAYYGLLRRLTFFGLNRAYLLGALLFAAVYPALPVPALLPAQVQANLAIPSAIGHSLTLRHASVVPGAMATTELVILAANTYVLGTALRLLRLLGQLLSLARLHRRTRPARALGQPVRRLPEPGGPFSFGRAIYLDDSTLHDPAGLAAALGHEQAHVRQAHTFDVLLAQLATALAWPNPAAWLLRRAVLANLEYLADRAALPAAGLDRRAYQVQLLARQAGVGPGPALAFHFVSSPLKTRIAMLNQPASSPRQLGRYVLAAPLVVALALGYAGARAQATAATRPMLDAPRAALPNPVYFLDGQRLDPTGLSKLNPNDIASINVLKEQTALLLAPNAVGGAILITTKAHEQAPNVRAFNERVGQLLPAQTEHPLQVNALVPKALATITARYPNSRLGGEVVEITDKLAGKVRYKVQLVTGRRPFYIYLTPAGEFISE